MKNRGFTLIEMMVVMAVFLFVIGAAITIFISTIQEQKRILSEQEILNQVSYVLEYMSKALRMAKSAVTDSDTDCLGQGNLGYVYMLTRPDLVSGVFKGIKFINQSNQNACQEFFLDNISDPSRPVLKELRNSSVSGDAVAITSTDFKINSIRFAINGTDGSINNCQDVQQCGASVLDSVQPKITILLNVQIPGDSQPAKIFQTTVSQRNLIK
jgi:prepilin-type N-terminal cleavage/methylation domain-containing protein